MLNSAFNFKLGHAVQQGMVAAGKFDGTHPSLAFATSSGNVMIHNPHHKDAALKNDMQQLAINRKVTAMASGNYGTSDRDILLVGTETNLLAYDVDRNADLYYKDVPDGVHAMQFGKVANVAAPLCLVGGNCSILVRTSLFV